jgi:outer membrane immunogenic protein
MLAMKSLHTIIAGLTLAPIFAITAPAANAADIYRAPPQSYKDAPVFEPPANSWAGFYIGVNGGYAWNNSGNSVNYNDGGAGFIGGADRSARAQSEGGFGGGQIGYNIQRGSLVIGFEADFQGGDISGTAASTTATGLDARSRERADWFGTARGRLGYAMDSTLIYFTGGFAYADLHQSAIVTDGFDAVRVRKNDLQTGYVLGGGIEYKLTPSWSLKGEYQYINLGNDNLAGVDTTGAAVRTNGLDTSFHTARIGLNYRFGGYDSLK